MKIFYRQQNSLKKGTRYIFIPIFAKNLKYANYRIITHKRDNVPHERSCTFAS